MSEDARKIFPRAFYLSQEQILYLYIHTGNPCALLSQLRLCFPGVHDVIWDTENPADKLSTLGDLKSELDTFILIHFGILRFEWIAGICPEKVSDFVEHSRLEFVLTSNLNFGICPNFPYWIFT